MNEGTREAAKQIMQPELNGGSYRLWFYNQSSTTLDILSKKALSFGSELCAQFGDEDVNYGEGLLFATFYGSCKCKWALIVKSFALDTNPNLLDVVVESFFLCHMFPWFRPQAALYFIKTFVGSSIPTMPYP